MSQTGEEEEPVEITDEPEGDEEGGAEQSGAEVQPEEQAETQGRTVAPFLSVRGTGSGQIRVRAGWRFEDGEVHSLHVDATVGPGQAGHAMAAAREWYTAALQAQARQAQEQADD